MVVCIIISERYHSIDLLELSHFTLTIPRNQRGLTISGGAILIFSEAMLGRAESKSPVASERPSML
jgi:hypothetical protein